jgi:hypothetical protein
VLLAQWTVRALAALKVSNSVTAAVTKIRFKVPLLAVVPSIVAVSISDAAKPKSAVGARDKESPKPGGLGLSRTAVVALLFAGGFRLPVRGVHAVEVRDDSGSLSSNVLVEHWNGRAWTH